MRRYRKELAYGALMIIGWLLITYGVAAIARPRVVWPVSLGLLAFSIAGWNLVARIAFFGLYDITRHTDPTDA